MSFYDETDPRLAETAVRAAHAVRDLEDALDVLREVYGGADLDEELQGVIEALFERLDEHL